MLSDVTAQAFVQDASKADRSIVGIVAAQADLLEVALTPAHPI